MNHPSLSFFEGLIYTSRSWRGLQLRGELTIRATGGRVNLGPVLRPLWRLTCPSGHHKQPRCPCGSGRRRSASFMGQQLACSPWRCRSGDQGERAPGTNPLWKGLDWSLCGGIRFGLGRISGDRKDQSRLQSLGFTPLGHFGWNQAHHCVCVGGVSAGAVRKEAAAYRSNLTAEKET